MSETDGHPSPPVPPLVTAALHERESFDWTAAQLQLEERLEAAEAAYRRGLERALEIIAAHEDDGSGIEYACRKLAAAVRAEIAAHANPSPEKGPLGETGEQLPQRRGE